MTTQLPSKPVDQAAKDTCICTLDLFSCYNTMIVTSHEGRERKRERERERERVRVRERERGREREREGIEKRRDGVGD